MKYITIFFLLFVIACAGDTEIKDEVVLDTAGPGGYTPTTEPTAQDECDDPEDSTACAISCAIAAGWCVATGPFSHCYIYACLEDAAGNCTGGCVGTCGHYNDDGACVP